MPDLVEELAGLAMWLTVEDAVRDADLAVDFVPDELESKLEIFSCSTVWRRRGRSFAHRPKR